MTAVKMNEFIDQNEFPSRKVLSQQTQIRVALTVLTGTVKMSAFNQSLVELMFLASKIGAPGERVRITEWIKKLATEANTEGTHPRLVQEYLEYLKLMLSGSPVYFVEPFAAFPPKNRKLVPLAEFLGNSLASACPYLPRAGQLAPVVLHSAGDDTSMISVNRDADGEVYCYMAIAPRND